MTGVLVVAIDRQRGAGLEAALLRLDGAVEVDVAGEHDGRPSASDAAEAAEAAARIARRHRDDPPVAVLAADDDAAALAAAVAAELDLPHHPVDAVALVRDPVGRRRAFLDAGVPHPEYRVVAPGDDVAHLARLVGLPCVVHPAGDHGEGPRVLAEDDEDAIGAVHLVRSVLADAGAATDVPVLVERSVPGVDLVLVGLIDRGALEVVVLFERTWSSAADPPDQLLVAPARLSRDARTEVVRIADRAAHALGLTHGPIHVDLRTDGRFVRVLDVRAGPLRGLVGLPVGFGRTVEQLVVAALLRGSGVDPVAEPPTPTVPDGEVLGVLLVGAPGSGRLEVLDGIDVARDADVVACDSLLAPGDVVWGPPAGNDTVARLVALAPSRREVEDRLAAARRAIRIEVDGGADAVIPPG